MRKIGELKGKPIIEGNPNEIKKNQIHYKESDGSITLSERKEDNTLSSVTSGSGSGEGVKEYYYYTYAGDFRGSVEMLLQSGAEMIVKINNKIEIVHILYFYMNPNIYFGIDMARYFRVPLTTFYINGEIIKDTLVGAAEFIGANHDLVKVDKELFDKACNDITFNV